LPCPLLPEMYGWRSRIVESDAAWCPAPWIVAPPPGPTVPPGLPDWLGSLRLQQLRVCDAIVTREIRRERGMAGLVLLDQIGDLMVTMVAGR